MKRATWAFLRLALAPFPRVWNVLGYSVTTALAVLAAASKHPLLAALVVTSALCLAFLTAGIRLELRWAKSQKREGLLDYLGRNLTMGEFSLDEIRRAGEGFDKGLEELSVERPDEETAKARLEELMNDDATIHAREWEDRVGKALSERLGYSWHARFKSDRGLTPATPPPVDEFYQRRWQHHEFRLQRLHQMIEELSSVER